MSLDKAYSPQDNLRLLKRRHHQNSMSDISFTDEKGSMTESFLGRQRRSTQPKSLLPNLNSPPLHSNKSAMSSKEKEEILQIASKLKLLNKSKSYQQHSVGKPQ